MVLFPLNDITQNSESKLEATPMNRTMKMCIAHGFYSTPSFVSLRTTRYPMKIVIMSPVEITSVHK